MKKLKLLFCSTLLVLSSPLSFGQNFLWGKMSSEADLKGDITTAVATDNREVSFGNAYIAGQFDLTLIFNTDTLTADDLSAYTVKYNSMGNVQWAKEINSNNGISCANSITTDLFENVYIAGKFSGNVQADTCNFYGPANQYNSDLFLVKYNSFTGNVIWAKQSILPSSQLNSLGVGCSVATDKSGNIFVSGYFQDTITIGGFTLNSIYSTNYVNPICDAFLVKYDSSGNVLWAKQSAIPSSHSSLLFDGILTHCSVSVDNLGNSYITGSFYDTISFGSYMLVSDTGYSGFLVKYSPGGNVLWAKKQSSESKNGACIPYGITIDKANNTYITGYFQDTVKFGPVSSYSPNGNPCVFLIKYDTNGKFVWGQQSSQNWTGTALACDTDNHIYLTGYTQTQYIDSIKFGNFPLYTIPSSLTACFLLKFDTAGYPICGAMLNNLRGGGGNGVASDYTGNFIYTASTVFSGDTVYFWPDTLSSSYEGPNTFLARWSPTCDSGLGIDNLHSQNANLFVYPNPSNGQFTIKSSVDSGQSSVEIYNMLGEKVFTRSINNSQDLTTFDLSNNSNGIYLYRVISETGQLIGDGKLIIQK